MKLLVLAFLVAGSVAVPAQNVATNPLVQRQLSLDKALVLYSDLTERTVLKYPALPNVLLTLGPSITNQVEIIRTIEASLATNGITLVPDGKKFVLVAPQAAAARLNPQAAQIPPAAKNDPAARIFPRGSIHWQAVRLSQALPIYAEVLGQKLDPAGLPLRTPDFEISFFNQTALTRAELGYALETLFAWNGVRLVSLSPGQLRAVPIVPDSANPTSN